MQQCNQQYKGQGKFVSVGRLEIKGRERGRKDVLGMQHWLGWGEPCSGLPMFDTNIRLHQDRVLCSTDVTLLATITKTLNFFLLV
jgi:hypothetical protein